MTNDETLVQELIRDEGVVHCAYQDSMGYWTIGVGRLIDKRKGGCLSDDEINYLLTNDIKAKESELDTHLSWWRNLSPVRQRVMVNMAFNLGTTGLLGFHNTLAAVQGGDYKAAAVGMRASKWHTDVGQRAERLAVMMENG